MNTTSQRNSTRCWIVAHPWMATLAAIVALVLFAVTQIAMNHNRYVRVKQWLGFVSMKSEGRHFTQWHACHDAEITWAMLGQNWSLIGQ